MKEHELPECPIETALMLFGEKWKFLIIRELLLGGTLRFKDLRERINGISDRMLSVKLNALLEDGLICKQLYAEVPPRAEYSLSALGQTLTQVFESLYTWGEMYQNLVCSNALPTDTPQGECE